MTAGLHHALDNATEAEAAARALERDEKVDVIVAISTTTARAVKRATTKIPIVFAAL
jgi:putative tryptophan/tyrosine transport system substrate-binding protein